MILPRQMKHTLNTRHYPTVQPLLAATKKETLQAVYTEAVTRAINNQQPNRVLRNRPPHAISSEEDTLRRPQRTTLSQRRSGLCRLLISYQNDAESSEVDRRSKMPRLWSQPSRRSTSVQLHSSPQRFVNCERVG